jgi:hypothetical protein
VTAALRLRKSETGQLTSVVDIVEVLCISGKGRRVYRFLLSHLISDLNEHKFVPGRQTIYNQTCFLENGSDR